MCQLLYSYNSKLKFQTFFFGLKAKDPLKKPLTLPKIFPYFLIFPSTNSSLVTYLALYKEDQVMHITHYYPSLSHSLILRLHHFAAHKYISISFSIQISLLRKQHNPWHNTKNHSSSNYKLMYLLYLTSISFILPYILQTQFSQNIYTSFSYNFNQLHISQSIYIQDPYLTKYLYIFLIHITNTTSYKTYIFLTISIHLKTYYTLFQEHCIKSPSHGRHIFIMLKALLMKGTNF